MMDQRIKEIALAIDEAIDNLDLDKLLTSIELCSTYLESAIETESPLLLYFKANAYSGLVQAKYEAEYAWSWSQDEAIQELLNLRLAINDPYFEKLNIVRQCQIRTNLANRLNSLGRSVEAIEHWDKVLSAFPTFAMALGNRAYGLNNYSRWLYDYTHRSILLSEASKGFGEAIDKEAFWDSGEDETIKAAFENRREEIENYLDNVSYLELLH